MAEARGYEVDDRKSYLLVNGVRISANKQKKALLELFRLHSSGASISEISSKLKKSPLDISNHLRSAHVLYEGIAESLEPENLLDRIISNLDDMGIIRLRASRSLTIEKFAAETGVSASTVRSWESSRSLPGKESRYRIRELYGQQIARDAWYAKYV